MIFQGEDMQGNKMDSNNLATLFAPNILHSMKPGDGTISPGDYQLRTNIIKIIKQNASIQYIEVIPFTIFCSMKPYNGWIPFKVKT